MGGGADPILDEYLARQRAAEMNRRAVEEQIHGVTKPSGIWDATNAKETAVAHAQQTYQRPQPPVTVAVDRGCVDRRNNAEEVLAARDARRKAELEAQEAATREAGRRVFMENQVCAAV